MLTKNPPKLLEPSLHTFLESYFHSPPTTPGSWHPASQRFSATDLRSSQAALWETLFFLLGKLHYNHGWTPWWTWILTASCTGFYSILGLHLGKNIHKNPWFLACLWPKGARDWVPSSSTFAAHLPSTNWEAGYLNLILVNLKINLYWGWFMALAFPHEKENQYPLVI